MNAVNLFLSALPHSLHFLPRAARDFQSPLSMGELSHEKSLVNAPREEPVLRGPTFQDRGRGAQQESFVPEPPTGPRWGGSRGQGDWLLKTTLPFSGNGVWLFTLSPPCSPYSVHQQEQTKPEAGNNSPQAVRLSLPPKLPRARLGYETAKMVAPGHRSLRRNVPGGRARLAGSSSSLCPGGEWGVEAACCRPGGWGPSCLTSSPQCLPENWQPLHLA